MSDYDNTNKGAAFPPFPEQQMILQGKLNIEGIDTQIVLVRDQTKSGKVLISVYQKVGVLFQQEKKNENQPDYSGPLEGHDANRVAAWKRIKDGRPYMTLSVSKQQPQGSEAQPDTKLNDYIPF